MIASQRDRRWIGARFADRRSIPLDPPLPEEITRERGDHALNLDMMPVLPLKHAIDLARPLMLARIPESVALHVAVLVAYAVVAYYVALVLTRRRLLK